MYAMEDVIHYAQKLIIKATFQYRDKLYREAKKTYEMVLFGMTCSNNMNGRGDTLSSSNNPSQFKCLFNSLNTVIYNMLSDYMNCCLAVDDHVAWIRAVDLLLDGMIYVYPKYNVETLKWLLQKAMAYLKLRDPRILNNDMGNINTKHPVQKRLKEKMIQDLKLAKDIALTIFGSKTSPTVIFTERTLEFVKRC